MQEVRPTTEPEFREALRAAAAAGGPIALDGAGTKRNMARGPGLSPAVRISTTCLRRVLQYEPRDLTISVQAGLPFAELTALLAENRQMIPFDPPYFHSATIGGVVASNTVGPRRRLYGTVRDFVIGMNFATLDGKLAKSGGMVVKNVAGFDMAKLLIGSFGTLASMTVINFKLAPMPVETRTFVQTFETAERCVAARDAVLRGVLQPAAIDILNPRAAARVGLSGFVLGVQAGGNPAVLSRYGRELPDAQSLDGTIEEAFWAGIREFTPAYLAAYPEAQVARASGTVTGISEVLKADAAIVIRAGSGVAYVHFPDAGNARQWMSAPESASLRYVMEYGEPAGNADFGSDFSIMKSVKVLFDPNGLLNSGRLYGRI